MTKRRIKVRSHPRRIGRKKVLVRRHFRSGNPTSKIRANARQLPIVKIGSKRYFVDARLNELRNINNPHDREKMEGSEEFYKKNFGAQWKVGIASPFHKEGLAWTASTNWDLLSADTLGKIGEKNVPIESIEAPTQKEAIREYKKLHPEFKKHFKQMDEEDVDLSI